MSQNVQLSFKFSVGGNFNPVYNELRKKKKKKTLKKVQKDLHFDFYQTFLRLNNVHLKNKELEVKS